MALKAAGTDSTTPACTPGHLLAAMWIPIPVPQKMRALEFLFCDHGTYSETYPVEHEFSVVRIRVSLDSDVSNGPALLFEIGLDFLFQRIACEIRGHDNQDDVTFLPRVLLFPVTITKL